MPGRSLALIRGSRDNSIGVKRTQLLAAEHIPAKATVIHWTADFRIVQLRRYGAEREAGDERRYKRRVFTSRYFLILLILFSYFPSVKLRREFNKLATLSYLLTSLMSVSKPPLVLTSPPTISGVTGWTQKPFEAASVDSSDDDVPLRDKRRREGVSSSNKTSFRRAFTPSPPAGSVKHHGRGDGPFLQRGRILGEVAVRVSSML
jgi:hypothetical protein